MTTSNISLHGHRALRQDRHSAAVGVHKLTAGVLTTVGVGLTIALGLAFGGFGVFTAVVALSLPLPLIWAASDVTRADED